MPELPDEKIEEAAAAPPAGEHRHDAVAAEDGTLLDHLEETHGLEAPPALSPSTQDGLHDRLHDTEKARDD
ncbi:MAG TPA: hypothetical protein VM142_10285 [Acidimicrobiales bacterium]|nr:hypothetical protein [Acidimicrobiales bacterium]